MNKKALAISIVLLVVLLGTLLFVSRQFKKSFKIEDTSATQSNSTIFSKVIIDPNFLGRTVVADVDGDGKNDVVVHRWGTKRGGTDNGELRWYKYPNWTSTTIKKDPNFFGDAIVAMDIDGNGKTDVVVGKQRDETSEVWVYLQQANNQWDEKKISDLEIDSGPGSEIKDIEIHDMDGDGKADIVVRTHSKVAVFFQNTNLAWDNKIITSETHEGMAVGNVGGSSKPDIVLNGFWYENDCSRNLANWKKYDFDTSWVESSGKGYPLNSVTVRIAKMNNDASNDIVVCHSEKENMPLNWYQAVNPTQGVGGWIKHKVGMVDYCHSMDAYDFDNDGDTDIMMVELPRKTDSSAYLFTNNGSQVFTKSKIVDGGGYKASVGDIDNDGDFDIISSKAWNTGVGHWDDGIVGSPLCFLQNNTSPPSDRVSLENWKRHIIDPQKGWKTVMISSADLDGDGYKDIITGGWWYKNPKKPNGSWEKKVIGEPLRNMAVLFDVDGQNGIDVIGTKGGADLNSSEVVWAQNDGRGNFTIRQNIPNGNGDFIQGAVAGILKGKQIALSWHGKGEGIQFLTIPENPAVTSWTRTVTATANQEEDLSLSDIDRDGKNDLLLGTKWLRNTNDGWSSHTISSKPGDPDRNNLADINQDGRLDAIIGFEAINELGKFVWYEQPIDSTKEWTEHVISTNVIGPMSLDVADMDGDGDLDIVVGEHDYRQDGRPRLLIFENINKGASWGGPYIVYTGDEHHDGTQVVDIDNDGDLDIISIGWVNNKVLLYENTSTLVPTNTLTPIPTNTGTPVGSNTPPTTTPHGNICGKADTDGDGRFTIVDFVQFALAYGMGKNTCIDKDEDYGTCGGRDVNRDGKLSIQDFGESGIGFAQRYYPRTSCSL